GHREILLGCPLCANSRYYAVQQSIASIGACTAEFWPVLGMGCKAWGTKTSVLQYLGQEQLRALATWCAEKIRGRRVLDDFAFVHEHHSIRNLTGKSHFVRNHNHSHSIFSKSDHYVEHLLNHLRIERRGRFVKQHGDRIHCKRSSDGDTLLLAT